MKVGDLIDWLYLFNNDDEIEIDVYETISKKYIDTTAAITVDKNNVVPTLVIDIEAEKVRPFLKK